MLEIHVDLYFHVTRGKYKYKRLPMGTRIAWFPMFFKNSCLSWSKTWNTLRLTIYLDDLLILTDSSFKDPLLKLGMVLARLSTAGMRVNISRSTFFAEQIEYLGYWITRQGIQPICKKVETIKKNQIQQFIGMFNYYRDM
jgi:hypothetical protein